MAARASSKTEAAIESLKRETNKKTDAKLIHIPIELSDLTKVKEAAEEFLKRENRLDVLINNAGYMKSGGAMYDVDPEEWWTPWTVNVRGTHEVTRAFLSLLLDCDGDKMIVNMTSIAAHMTGPGFTSYKVPAPPIPTAVSVVFI